MASALHLRGALLLLLAAATSTANASAPASDDTPLPPALPGSCSWSSYGYPFPDGLDVCPRPVSDITKERSFAPWSYPPVCARSANHTKYCVYTSRTYRGRGLSVISTPQGAANLVAALDDTRVPPRLRDNPASTMAPREVRKAARPYVIKKVPGKGRGLVARKRVPKWGQALIGFPIMVARTDFLTELDDAQRKHLEEVAMRQLPQAAQDAIWALAHGLFEDKEFLLEHIFRSNIFGIEIAGVPHFALQVEGSRINHECKPNTFWRYSPSSMTHEVVAFQEINMGEEFTHSYIPLGLPIAERKESIRRWGFECHCPLCSAPKNVVFASEIRRTRLIEIYSTLEDEAAAGTLTRDKIEDLVKEMMLLINGEDLAAQLCEYYATVARAYLSIEDVEEARYYAGQSEEFWIRYGTEEHENIEGVRELWQQVKAKEQEIEARRRRQDEKQGSKY